MKRGNNILTTFLNALKVKYTKSFSNKFYNEHPYKYNLFGLSKMLDFYGVSNAGFRIKEKHTAIFELPTPFIAQIDGDFALVDTVSAANVSYRLGNHSLILALDEFCEKWTGVVLLAERHANSIEPDYLFHKKSEVINSSLRYGFIVLVITTLLIGFFHNNSMQLGSLILLIANSLGVFIGYLLVEQQINTSGSYSDKICSLFRESDCNDILESKASKLFGIVSWGEIGLAYFVSNLIVLCFFPELIEYSGIMSGLSLGYVCWSVWYQKFRARQWCVLCLASLLVLLLLFFVNLSLGYISLRGVTIDDLLLIILIYLIPILACVNLLPHIRGKNKTENVMQEINSLKVHQGVLGVLLKEQPYFACDRSVSQIVFGEPNSDILITILSNPHCNPCADLHTRIHRIIDDEENTLCVQYIFTSFSKELEVSNRFLIAAYLNSVESDRKSIFNEWFKTGKDDKENFFKKYDFDLNNEIIQAEFFKHNQWKASANLDVTPTILVNGYKLPNNFRIEDLAFIEEIHLPK